MVCPIDIYSRDRACGEVRIWNKRSSGLGFDGEFSSDIFIEGQRRSYIMMLVAGYAVKLCRCHPRIACPLNRAY